MKYFKNCPTCNIIQSYSKLNNYKRAIKNNTLCKKCNANLPNQERNLKISKALKGKPKSKESVDKMKSSLKKLWELKTEDEMNEWRTIVSKTSKLRWDSVEYKKRVSDSVRAHWESMSDVERTIRYNNQQLNGAGICKYYKVGEYNTYGTVERRYIEELYKSNSEMPIVKKRNGIRTPYGMVFIDFEYELFFTEIKSTYTFDKLINEYELDNSQLKKIIWVNYNIKPVKILVETDRYVFSDYTELAILPFIKNTICEYSGLLSTQSYN
jgi:hypothetical protein